MKKLSIFISFAILFLAININTANALFFDVMTTNAYYNAITFMENNGIVNGYSDNTFKPDNNISRAEFVKIITLSSGLKLDISTNSGFSDVPENSWYAPYVKKAKSEGIIGGYPDGTFKPDQYVTKAEALKIIGAAEKWKIGSVTADPFLDVPKSAWFAPFVDFAKTNNIINPGTKLFLPGEFATRGLISDFIYRTDKNGIFKVAKVATAQPTTPNQPIQLTSGPDVFKPFINPAGTIVTNQTPVSFAMVGKSFFDNVTLDSDFPNTFYANEVYNFSGSVSGAYDSLFVFLTYKDQFGTDKNLEFSGIVSGGRFNIPAIFKYPGTYTIGIILGTQGTSKIKSVSVLNSLPNTSANTYISPPSTPSISFANSTTTASYSANPNSVIRITFSQGDKKVSYISRQQKNNFDVPYEDFYIFQPGTINLNVENATTTSIFPLEISSMWSGSGTSFIATRHLFSKLEKNKISTFSLPETMSFAKQITFSGITSVNILKQAQVIKPNGQVEAIDIQSNAQPTLINGINIIPKNSSYTFTYNPQQTGTYVIGISEDTGSAIINVPIYIGNVIPLLPDFFDIKDYLDLSSYENISGAGDKFLIWVNNARQGLSLTPVKLDAVLTILAQSHSDDMAKNNYFSHTDLQGNSPNDRRIKMNIPTEVGENIAKTQDLVSGFEGFMRSPSHRKNILNPDWRKVGLGFAKDTQGNILITQEFSPDPLSLSDVTNIKNGLITYINAERQKQGISGLTLDANISSIAQAWSDKMARGNFTDLVASDGMTLQSLIEKNISSSYIKMFVYSQNSDELFNENIFKQLNLNDSSMSNIGIGLTASGIGELKATIIMTK